MFSSSEYYKVEKSQAFFKNEQGLALFIKKLLTQQGKVFEVTQDQGKLVPYHCHAHQELIIVLEGSARFIIEEDIVDVNQGDIIFIEPWAIHLACFPNSQARFFLCFPQDSNKFSFS